jgi:opine dehydrogenase
VVTTAADHRDVAKSCAPYLKDGQLILLMPGYLGGSLEFFRILKEGGADCENLIILETDSLIYSCRAREAGHPRIHGIKDKFSIAAFPAKHTDRAIKKLKDVYPQLIPAKNVFETGFNNVNPMLHVPITIFNLSRVERKEDWSFYSIGATPLACKYIEKIDAERMLVAKVLEANAISTKDIIKNFYGVYEQTLHETIQKNHTYKVSKGPTTVNDQFFYEDLPMGLVPIASLGEMLKVEIESTKALIHIASVINGVDYWNIGMTVERMGLKGKSSEAIKKFLYEGDTDR